MKIIRFWGPVVVWMAVIFAFSARQRVSVSQQEALNFLFFKTLHVIEYSFLYLLLYRAMKNLYTKKKEKYWVIWSFIILVLYAASDEIHQLFVPTREGALRDVIIDTAGASLAWIFLIRLLPKMPKKLRKLAATWLSI